MWYIASSMWAVTAFMWTVTASTWAVIASMNAVQALFGMLHPLFGILHHLYMIYRRYVSVTIAMWAITSSMWAVTACMHTVQALCGLFHSLCGMLQPTCGLSLAKTGNEDIVLYGGYRAFTNILRTCPSLTTWAYMGLRFDPRWSRPTIITGNQHREPVLRRRKRKRKKFARFPLLKKCFPVINRKNSSPFKNSLPDFRVVSETVYPVSETAV